MSSADVVTMRAILIGNVLGGLVLLGFGPWVSDMPDGYLEDWITAAIRETGRRPGGDWEVLDTLVVILRRLGLCDEKPTTAILDLVLPLADQRCWPTTHGDADALYDRILLACGEAA